MNVNKENLARVASNYRLELELASSGGVSSVSFLKTRLFGPNQYKGDIVTIVIGGTNYQFAITQCNTNEVNFLSSVTLAPIPKLPTQVDFINFLSGLIAPKIKKLNLVFAHKMQPLIRNGRPDGRILELSKDSQFGYLKNKRIGEFIEDEFIKRNQKLSVSVTNDMVALLNSNPNTHLAVIVGTGYNLGLIDARNNAINTESANFNKFEIWPTLKLIDKQSTNPGHNLFEKAVSGYYLPKQYNYEKDSSFSPLSSAHEIDQLARSQQPGSKLAQRLLQRSAQLVAAQIAGAYQFLNKNTDIVALGSVITKAYKYQDTLVEAVQGLTGYKPNIIKPHHPEILGASRLP